MARVAKVAIHKISKQSKISAKTPTRKTTLCPIFETLAEMSQLRLPTNADAILHYLFVRNEKKGIMAGKDPPASIIATETANTIVGIWKKSSVPTITFKKQSENYTKKLKELKLSWEETLFDIASCKCKDLNDCYCSKAKKIPAQEREFVIDQRTTRSLVIGSIDVASSRKTGENIAKRLKEVEAVWNKIRVNEDEIQKLKIPEHVYFENAYFIQLQKKYEETKDYLVKYQKFKEESKSETIRKLNLEDTDQETRLKKQKWKCDQLNRLIQKIYKEIDENKINSKDQWLTNTAEKTWEYLGIT
ncbi:unnamed protein product [Psylliodes chrysocephalus]|uniref:Uncharacterized protein n=1 Tax=Psylliodes chrysocephalus TaxID=3402493 RepID=A0A9P0D7C3_9CUCU|nr:unnamed protein product [Psylliodes chrysocephala]